MISWQIPASGPTIGITIRAGARGAVVPMLRGSLFVGQRQMRGDLMEFRYARTSQTITARVSSLDVLSIAERGPVTLYATVYQPSRVQTYTTTIYATDEVPDGLVYALVTRDGVYYTGEGLTGAENLTVKTAAGSYTLPNPGGNVSFVPQNDLPLSVTATDDEGLTSPEMLAGVEVEPDGGQSYTALSAWPLPPYLKAERPNLAAYLAAFASALDVRPEQAGRYLYLDTSSGAALTELAALYGITRADAADDPQMIRQVRATGTQAKASLEGLTTMLNAAGYYGVTVTDVMDTDGQGALFLDGTWSLDGSRLLDGGHNALGLVPGEVAAIFRRPPVQGFDGAWKVMNTYTATGIRARIMLRQGLTLPFAAPGVRLSISRPVKMPLARLTDPFLRLDGSWNLDGSQALDGLRL